MRGAAVPDYAMLHSGYGRILPMLRPLWFALCLLATLATAAAPASAHGWPTPPITMVVPLPPGAALDLVARLVGMKLAGALGQTFVTENRTGANGMIGANLVARAPPDGYMLL